MFKNIKEICSKYDIIYNDKNEYLSEFILLLFNSNDINNNLNLENDNNKFLWISIYYKNIKKDYELMKKYYLMAIELGSVNAIRNLSNYHFKVEKNYDQMKKYYLLAIEKGNDTAMNNLGLYYYETEKDYEQMIKYYQMAIELGSDVSLNNLKKYFGNNKLKLYKLLKKITNKNELINKEINSLENDKQIIIYNNKINIFKNLNNYKKCALCLEDNMLNIILNCGHEICIDCYDTDIKCVYKFCQVI